MYVPYKNVGKAVGSMDWRDVGKRVRMAYFSTFIISSIISILLVAFKIPVLHIYALEKGHVFDLASAFYVPRIFTVPFYM